MLKENKTLAGLFRTPAVISLLHSAIVVCVLVSLVTGFRLATVAEPMGWLAPIMRLLPQGAVHQWHFISGTLLIAAMVGYLGYLLMMRRFSRLALDVSTPVFLANKLKENLLRLTIWLGLILLFMALITGVLLFLGIYPSGYQALNQLHQLLAVALLVYMLLHILAAYIARGAVALVKIFLPSFNNPPQHFWVVALGVPVVASAILLAAPKSLQKTLPVVRIADAIHLDGEANDKPWQVIPRHTVMTANGHNFPSRQVPVTIQAAHDGEHAYFLFRWPDKSRSLKHLPLLKTEEGWTVLQTDAAHADENNFYEDKFAVMLSRTDKLAGAGTIHLGHKPLKDHPAPIGGRGLHYTLDGSITDVWHWKAVRTGYSIGQADDNHFGRPLPSDSEFLRYTGGYQRDPDCEHKVRWQAGDYHLKPECGGYIANWDYYKDGIIEPRRLPTNKKLVRQLEHLNLNSDSEDRGRWWMNWDETEKYNPDKDTLPIGSVIPSVLSLGPYTLGRAGISASATWRDGFWTLEMKRRLQADSKYDLPIESGVFFWVAAFNHSQVRHTYHIHPLKLDVQ